MKALNIQSLLLILAMALLVIAPVNATPSPEPKKCVSNDGCSKDEFCDTTPNCQDGKVSGVCTEKPQFCTMEYIPVKGCDGKTYSNRCHAQAEAQPITGLAVQPK